MALGAGLILDLEEVLGCKVEVVTEKGLNEYLRDRVLAEAVPLVKDDTIFLRHILECSRPMEADTVAGRDEFMSSHTLQDAVLRNLQTVSEPTQRVSEFSKGLAPADRLAPDLRFSQSACP